MKINLNYIVDTICAIASGERNVNTIIQGDVYTLDAQPDTKYCVFCISQNDHTESSDFIYFNFTLFYINRLTNDESSNELLSQSTGMQVLRNIIRKTCTYLDIDVTNDLVYTNFEQQFADMCAGTYVTVEFQVPLDLCFEDYGDSDDILDRQ